MSCVFCAIVAGEAPAIRIYEDDDYLAILDIRPFTRGHTLVIPKEHTVDLTDTPPHDRGRRWRAIGQRIAKAARASGLHADGNNIADQRRQGGVPDASSTSTCTWCRAATGDKLSFAKGLVVRRDPDREETGRHPARRTGATRRRREGLTAWASRCGSNRTSASGC